MLDLISSGLMEYLRYQRKMPKMRGRRKRRRFKQRIYFRDRGICAYCDSKVRYVDSTLDHVTPLVHGGSDRHKENFVISCADCNRKKAQLMLEVLDDLAPEKLRLKFAEAYEKLNPGIVSSERSR